MATAIFDGNYLLHRVMHVPHLRQLSSKDGKPTGGTFGVIKSLRSTLYQWHAINRVIMVFDGGHSKRRLSLHPEYKKRTHTEEVDPDGIPYKTKFLMQARYLNFILPRIGIKVVRVLGKEADDIIGLLCRRLDDELIMVSSDDKDMQQLVTERVQVWRPIAEELITAENFLELTGAERNHWMLRKAILGDPTDNIDGVPGVGGKTVDMVLSAYPDIGKYPHEKLFQYAAQHSSKRVQAIADHIDKVLLNFELLDVFKEEFSMEEIMDIQREATVPSSFDIVTVKRMFMSMEFYSLIEDFPRWITRFQTLR